MGRLIDADAVVAMTATCPKEMDIDSFIEGMGVVLDRVYDAPTVDAVPLDTKIVMQMYDVEHEEWYNEIMTIQELLDSGMCEIYREECKDQYE